MQAEKLFNGIAVIIDNEIQDEGSDIYKIKGLIETKNIPVATFTEVPSVDVVSSLGSASFIILDWDYTNGELEIESDERISIPSELSSTIEERLIEFIKCLLNDIFVPVFIFTAKSKETIVESLKDASLWDDEKSNRIFIKQKAEVDSDEELFSAIDEWVKAMPSVYVLKEWEHVLYRTKNSMFNELYSYSPNWAKIIWDMLKEDSIENQREFGNFVTRSLVNRIIDYSFDETLIQTTSSIKSDELRKVVEGERYFSYESQPEQAYTGDLYKDGSKYYLNIRAQCSMARRDDKGNYNPTLYCIKGKKLRNQDIVSEDIRFTTENELVFDANKRFSFNQICEFCKDESKLEEINKNFSKHRNSIFFRKGSILERDDKVIIGCVAGEQAICFDMDICVFNYEDMKEKRIGRILSPYITKIQQKCAINTIREGVLPLPKELFLSFDE